MNEPVVVVVVVVVSCSSFERSCDSLNFLMFLCAGNFSFLWRRKSPSVAISAATTPSRTKLCPCQVAVSFHQPTGRFHHRRQEWQLRESNGGIDQGKKRKLMTKTNQRQNANVGGRTGLHSPLECHQLLSFCVTAWHIYNGKKGLDYCLVNLLYLTMYFVLVHIIYAHD